MSDFNKLETLIQEQFANTNTKIESIQSSLDGKINTLQTNVDKHSERITQLETYAAQDSHRFDIMEHQIQICKQHRLRNNIRLTGLPTQACEKAVDTVMKIISLLQVSLVPSDFIAYTDRNRSSIIVAFESYSFKRYFTDALRKMKGLSVEQILGTKTNSKLSCNDQLTPYFADLLKIALNARKDEQLHAVSSLGGQIKVRKIAASNFVVIQSIAHLNEIIQSEVNIAPTSEAMADNLTTTDNGPSGSKSPDHSTSNNTSAPISSVHTEPRGLANPPYSNPQETQPSTHSTSHSTNHHNTNRSNHWKKKPLNAHGRADQQWNKQRNKHQDQNRYIQYSPPKHSQYTNSRNYRGPDWNNNTDRRSHTSSIDRN